jgi:hypothetical protein
MINRMVRPSSDLPPRVRLRLLGLGSMFSSAPPLLRTSFSTLPLSAPPATHGSGPRGTPNSYLRLPPPLITLNPNCVLLPPPALIWRPATPAATSFYLTRPHCSMTRNCQLCALVLSVNLPPPPSSILLCRQSFSWQLCWIN